MQTNLEYYKIFYYVSKYNSISLAAEALSISPVSYTHLSGNGRGSEV